MMKARIPQAWERMPKKQQAKVREHAINIAKKQMEIDARRILDLYIKMVCVVLHDACGFGEKRLIMFLGNHKRLFHRQCKMVANNTQEEYLNRRMAEIFKREGFPKDFFDKMLGEVIMFEEDV